MARLMTTPDDMKDQTYFLAGLSQSQLSRCMFPLGRLTKAQVRETAERFELPTMARKDSQGICFLGKVKFDEFVKEVRAVTPRGNGSLPPMRHAGQRSLVFVCSSTMPPALSSPRPAPRRAPTSSALAQHFLPQHLGEWSGPLVDEETGEVVGYHRGFWFYTVGQRKGIRLPGGPWFVARKDIRRNVVFISRR